MRVICTKESLLNATNIALKGVSSKTTLPILQCILLKAVGNQLTLIGTDLEIGIESYCEANIQEAGTIAVEARIFSDIIRRLPNSDVELVVDPNQQITISCETSQFKILGQPGLEFPDLPHIDKHNSYNLKQLDLRNMIRETLFSVAQEETKPILTGELIEIREGKMNMVSVDGYRVSFRQCDLSNENTSTKVVVPGKTLTEVSKILTSDEDNVAIFTTGNHILFDLGHSMLVSRLLEGEFLNYEQIFPKEFEVIVTANRKSLLDSIDRAALISRESKKNPIKMEIIDDKMVITSNTEIGMVHEEVPITLKGNELTIAFNPKYLLDALKVISDEEIAMTFNSPVQPCVIQPVDGNDFKYLILPIRLNA